MYVTYTERFSPSPSLWPRTFINHWRRNWIKPRVTWNTGSKSLPCWYTKTKWGNKVSDEAFKTKAGSDSLKADELAKKKKNNFSSAVLSGVLSNLLSRWWVAALPCGIFTLFSLPLTTETVQVHQSHSSYKKKKKKHESQWQCNSGECFVSGFVPPGQKSERFLNTNWQNKIQNSSQSWQNGTFPSPHLAEETCWAAVTVICSHCDLPR